MEVPMDLSPILGGSLIRLDGLRLKQLQNTPVISAIDRMGEFSSQSVMSNRPVTTAQRMIERLDQTMYLLWEKGEQEGVSYVIGYIKVGHKSLYLYDKGMHGVQGRTLCVFDFYVHFSRQRRGCGKALFDFMTQNEKTLPQAVALDNPSMPMLAFMGKHFGLSDPIWQNTNYVIYPEYFQMLQRKGAKMGGGLGPQEEDRPSTPQRPPNEPCGKDGMANSPVGDQSTEGTLANRAQQCRQRKQHILGHVPLWFVR